VVYLAEKGNRVILKIHVQPNSSKNEIVGFYHDTLRIKIAAPALDGRANRACIRYLAEFFEVKPSQVDILKGQASRIKLLEIKGVSKERLLEKLVNRG
jgi:uncharacterized protein (TIGR00251 family)